VKKIFFYNFVIRSRYEIYSYLTCLAVSIELMFCQFSFIFIFIGKLEIKEETVESLLSTSCLLQLSKVIEECCSFLSKQLHPSNCLGIRQFADSQGCSELYREANDYVVVS